MPGHLLTRRLLTGYALLGMLTGACAQTTVAPVMTLIVPYAAGGTGDALARILGEAVGKTTALTVVVDNKPGGGTVIGTLAAKTAPTDGRTLLINAASSVINPYLMPKMAYDINKDFTPVSLLASNPHILVVHPKVPVDDLAGFVAWARQKKGAASYASFGNGSSGHLGFELFKKTAGIDMLHVPYKGVAPAANDLLGGQVDAMLTDLAQVVPQIRAGKLKAIAIASESRTVLLPTVPTFTEAGLPGFTSKSWFGLLVRSETPSEQVAQLNKVFAAALREPAVKEKLAQAGMDPVGSTAAMFSAFMAAESRKYGEAVRFSGAKLD